MIEKKLEIFVITYNRANDLKKTLEKLLSSPFCRCKLTILDNCSNDETNKICSRYQKQFSNFQAIRHPKNIGASANYLRAVELSNKEYTWILCDDDQYDFSYTYKTEKAITENFDLILVGEPSITNINRCFKTTVQKLNEKILYYYTLSFIPSIIYKTELFDSKCIQEGYKNAATQYPHFPFINKTVQNDYSIYISNIIVKRSKFNSPPLSNLNWLINWIKCCLIINEKKTRKKAIYELTRDYKLISMIKNVVLFIGQEKISNNKLQTLDMVLLLYKAFGLNREIIIIFIVLLLSIVPNFVYRKAIINIKN